jgi:uncharacterized protein
MTLADFWIAAGLVAISAGFVQGFTGFGFALIFTPLLVLIAGAPQQVILLALLIGSVLSLGVLLETYRMLDLVRTWPLVVAASLSTPLGIGLLHLVDTRALKVLIAITTLAIATLWMVRLPPPFARERIAFAIAGLLGGFLNGATSMGGPPPALTIGVQRLPVNQGRAALTTFNLLSYLIGLATASFSGLAQPEFLAHRLWLLPCGVAGCILGGLSARRVSRSAFGRALSATVWLAGLLGLLSVLLR